MTIDPRTPVIVAVGQSEQRFANPFDSLEPIDLLAEAVHDAGKHKSIKHLTAKADTICVIDMMSWDYADPAKSLARRIHADPRRTIATSTGGNSPQMMLNHLAREIQSGVTEVAILGGVECVNTRWRARKIDPPVVLDWSTDADPPCPNVMGDPRPGTSDYENAHAAFAPTSVYPLFETAIRHASGRSIEEHRREVGALWEHFASQAAKNPRAWSKTAYSADEITLTSPTNRMVVFPYTKLMCANIDVDQAAAIVMCSYGAATEAGVPSDEMVFPWSGAEANDHYFFTERWSLADSPAIATAVSTALAAAEIGMDDISQMDLYSCFPSAVQLAMRALKLKGPKSDSRPLTLTGGLGFAGGPGNAYVVRSIAAMVDACRETPGSVGLVTALGWYATKHAAGIYSTTPPSTSNGAAAFVEKTETQPLVDSLPSREPAGAYTGAAKIEATAVVMERDGSPSQGIISALCPDGRRVLLNTSDKQVLTSMTEEAWEGREIQVVAGKHSNTLEV